MLWEMATLAEQPYQGFTNDEVSCGLRHGTRNNQDNLNELMSLEVFIHPLRMIRRPICSTCICILIILTIPSGRCW